MSASVLSPGALVRVRDGVRVGDYCLDGVRLRVVSVPAVGVVELSEYAGNRVFLLAADVDVMSGPVGAS